MSIPGNEEKIQNPLLSADDRRIDIVMNSNDGIRHQTLEKQVL